MRTAPGAEVEGVDRFDLADESQNVNDHQHARGFEEMKNIPVGMRPRSQGKESGQ